MILTCLACVAGYLGWTRFPDDGARYLLLTIVETNTAGLIAIPLEGDCPRAVRPDEQARTLAPLRPEYAPDRRTKCLVVYDVDFAGVRVSSEAHKIRSYPHRIPLGNPITIMAGAMPSGEAPGADSVNNVPIPVCDNRFRYYAGDMSLEGISNDGTATLSLDGEVVEVVPGQAWTAARIREGDRVGEARPGPGWDGRLREAFNDGHPISRLTIINHGFWEKERVAECGR